MEASIVTVVVMDLDSVFCSRLFKGKLGDECFVGLVVKLEVDKMEAAIVVNKDSGAFVVLLCKFAFNCA